MASLTKGIGINSPAALSDGINTNWLCGMGTDLPGNTGGKERDRLIPLVAASALMGTLTGGGATHPLSSTASATAKAAKNARPRINIGTPQKIFCQSIADANCRSEKDASSRSSYP
jgi:hypothetical protein